jgi:hypothetical protein
MLNGYLVYKKKLSKEEQKLALSCIDTDSQMVDYSLLKRFIDNYFLPKIPFSNPVYVKARLSNNNNSIDASVLHSDVYNFTSEKEFPVYTALCYFDKAQLELIPGSHLKPRESFIAENNKRIVLDLEPGDIVLFNAAIMHRGVNFTKEGDRRVLQVFEIFPTQEIYNENIGKLLTVDTSTNSNSNSKNLLYYVAQIKWLIEIVNFIGFYLSYNNLKYKLFGMDLPPWQKKGRYVTYEPGGRVYYHDGLVDKININVVFNDTEFVKYSHFYLWVMLFIFCIIFYFVFLR